MSRTQFRVINETAIGMKSVGGGEGVGAGGRAGGGRRERGGLFQAPVG